MKCDVRLPRIHLASLHFAFTLFGVSCRDKIPNSSSFVVYGSQVQICLGLPKGSGEGSSKVPPRSRQGSTKVAPRFQQGFTKQGLAGC